MLAILCFVLLATSCYSSEIPEDLTELTFDSGDGAPVKNQSVFKKLWKKIRKDLDPSIKEDSKLTTDKLITKYGYTAEVHFVTTEDGYILQMHRISGGPKSPPKEGKKVCFLQHGIMDSSSGWILSGPGHALGYRLADEGYDVWMGNSRGNLYSTKHIQNHPYSLFPSARTKYWSFTWHEMGVYDLPASIDYVLKKTGQQKLQYIAHSQGTTAFFVMMSERPEMNDKVQMMHALAPVAFMSHVYSPTINAVAPFIKALKNLVFKIGLHSIPPTTSVLALGGYAPTSIAMKNVLLSLMGYNTDQSNSTLLPVILGHVPAGCAVDQLFHYGQLMKTGRFQQYDKEFFQEDGSWDTSRPQKPDYNLKNVKVPVALYYSEKDWIADFSDVQRLKGELPNVIEDYPITQFKFNHIDFMWGKNASTVIYDRILSTMKRV